MAKAIEKLFVGLIETAGEGCQCSVIIVMTCNKVLAIIYVVSLCNGAYYVGFYFQ